MDSDHCTSFLIIPCCYKSSISKFLSSVTLDLSPISLRAAGNKFGDALSSPVHHTGPQYFTRISRIVTRFLCASFAIIQRAEDCHRFIASSQFPTQRAEDCHRSSANSQLPIPWHLASSASHLQASSHITSAGGQQLFFTC